MEDVKKKELISLDETARLLDVKPDSLKKRIYRDKNIPHYKIAGDLKFDYEAILNYFKKA